VIDIYVLIALIVILGVVLIALALFTLQRLKARRTKLLNDLASSPRHAGDRAFNRIEMARREAALLGRQGTDTSRARELIAQAQSAFDLGQFPRAYEAAQSAHESLVHARQSGPLAGSAPPTSSPRPAPASPLGSPAGNPPTSPRAEESATPPLIRPRLAPNRAESQFQLHLLDSDLDSARTSKGASPSVIATASALRSQAQAAFDRTQYTEALKMALRGRRELGGKVETLAVTGGGSGAVASQNASDPLGSDPELAAERAASSSRCAQCGYPTRADDTFCRGCGRPLTPTACPSCGAARSATDTFCGKCGQRFS
jgi:hypothetical protein